MDEDLQTLEQEIQSESSKRILIKAEISSLRPFVSKLETDLEQKVRSK